jgi:hypothetical protein
MEVSEHIAPQKKKPQRKRQASTTMQKTIKDYGTPSLPKRDQEKELLEKKISLRLYKKQLYQEE